MIEREKIFDSYISEFINLNLPEKRKEFIIALKELILVIDNIAKVDNIPLEYLKNNEILDIQKESYTEDDFLEASMVYLEIAKDIIGQYIISKDYH